jgi:hypothetical protein
MSFFYTYLFYFSFLLIFFLIETCGHSFPYNVAEICKRLNLNEITTYCTSLFLSLALYYILVAFFKYSPYQFSKKILPPTLCSFLFPFSTFSLSSLFPLLILFHPSLPPISLKKPCLPFLTLLLSLSPSSLYIIYLFKKSISTFFQPSPCPLPRGQREGKKRKGRRQREGNEKKDQGEERVERGGGWRRVNTIF